jgi:hypothetical protein
MAFETYTALISGVADFLNRADVTTAKIDYSICLMESAFNRNIRVLEMESQTAGLTLTTSALSGTTSVIPHPADFLAWKSIKVIDTRPTDVEIATQVNVAHDLNYEVPGRPTRAVRGATGTELWPAPDATYTYRYLYYAKVPALTSANTTNWLLLKHPDLYFTGAMAYLNYYLKNVPEVGAAANEHMRILVEIKAASERDAFSGQPLRVIRKGVV